MKKVLVSVFFLVSTVFVAGLCYAAWSPVVPPVQAEEPAAPVPALDSHPVVVETSAVLVLAHPAKEAPKARPVARRPKQVDCSNAKHKVVEDSALGTKVLYCHD